MPNNFRISGSIYVSKFGNDSWSGTSPDSPKRTVQAGFNTINASGQTLVIGEGVYNETIVFSFVNFINVTIIADGEVIFDGYQNKTVVIRQFGTGTNTFIGFTFRGYSYIYYECFTTPFNRQHAYDIRNCKFIGPNLQIVGTGNRASSSTTPVYINCLFYDVTSTNNFDYNYRPFFSNCTLMNFYQEGRGHLMTGSYLDPNSVFVSIPGISAASINYNNVRGAIVMRDASIVTTGIVVDTRGYYYDLSLAGSGGSGTLGDPYRRSNTAGTAFNYQNYLIAYPSFTTGSFNLDPKFNDPENLDYSLQADSPHIGRAISKLTNIGSTNYEIRIPATGSYFGASQSSSLNGVVLIGKNYAVSSSLVTASITSAPILVSYPGKVLGPISYKGLLAFNKDSASYSGSNVNVPTYDTYTSSSGNLGANPDRLNYYMRFTTGSSQPSTDQDWENCGLWEKGGYRPFIWGLKPGIDVFGLTNGDPRFSTSSYLAPIKASYIQLQIKLRNDYST